MVTLRLTCWGSNSIVWCVRINIGALMVSKFRCSSRTFYYFIIFFESVLTRSVIMTFPYQNDIINDSLSLITMKWRGIRIFWSRHVITETGGDSGITNDSVGCAASLFIPSCGAEMSTTVPIMERKSTRHSVEIVERVAVLQSSIVSYEGLSVLWKPTDPNYMNKSKRNAALNKLLSNYAKAKPGIPRADTCFIDYLSAQVIQYSP